MTVTPIDTAGAVAARMVVSVMRSDQEQASPHGQSGLRVFRCGVGGCHEEAQPPTPVGYKCQEGRRQADCGRGMGEYGFHADSKTLNAIELHYIGGREQMQLSCI